MRLLVSFAFVFSSVLAAAAQAPQPTPPPQPRATPASTPQPMQTIIRPIQPAMNRIQNPFSLNPVSDSDRLAQRIVYLQRVIAPLYRKPSGKELEALAPSSQLVAKYAEFLRLPDTGIFRLIPDAGCSPNVKVVSAKDECLKYTMPGAGNSFSFRTGNYRIRHLADVTYDGEALHVTGVFMHGFMAKLGDLPIESVGLASPGLKFVADFKPSTTVADVSEIDMAFRKGIEVGGYRYAMSLPVEPDTTFVYRGVAYRGKVLRSADGIRYNELEYDDREDVIVVFRIVEKAEDKSITVIWRILAETEPPKIKIPARSNKNNDNLSGGN